MKNWYQRSVKVAKVKNGDSNRMLKLFKMSANDANQNIVRRMCAR